MRHEIYKIEVDTEALEILTKIAQLTVQMYAKETESVSPQVENSMAIVATAVQMMAVNLIDVLELTDPELIRKLIVELVLVSAVDDDTIARMVAVRSELRMAEENEAPDNATIN